MNAIYRPFERRLVTWRGSTDSNEIVLTGAAYNLYIPSTFAGTSISVKALVRRQINDSVTGEAPIEAYKTYQVTSLDVTAGVDRVYDLTSLNLFGLEKIKFVSSASETCTGEVMLVS